MTARPPATVGRVSRWLPRNPCVSRASTSSSAKILADSAIALVMTTLIYLAFDRLLTLSLPSGPLERLL
jgi:hypothetical protein